MKANSVNLVKNVVLWIPFFSKIHANTIKP